MFAIVNVAYIFSPLPTTESQGINTQNYLKNYKKLWLAWYTKCKSPIHQIGCTMTCMLHYFTQLLRQLYQTSICPSNIREALEHPVFCEGLWPQHARPQELKETGGTNAYIKHELLVWMSKHFWWRNKSLFEYLWGSHTVVIRLIA